MYEQLKKPVLCYLVFGILFSASIVSNITINKYNKSLEDVARKLKRIKGNIGRMEEATREIEAVTLQVNEYIPLSFFESSTEGELYSALDSLKKKLNQPEVSATNTVEKEDEISLPLKIAGPIDSFSDVVNDAGFLRSMSFPFFKTSAINLIRKVDKDGVLVSYILVGEMHMPRRGNLTRKKPLEQLEVSATNTVEKKDEISQLLEKAGPMGKVSNLLKDANKISDLLNSATSKSQE